MPPVREQIVNGALALARHAYGGFRLAEPDVVQLRLAKCEEPCDYYEPVQKRCRLCGCFVATKTTWAGEKCPDGRWEKSAGRRVDGAPGEGELLSGLADPLHGADWAGDVSWFARAETRKRMNEAFHHLLEVPLPTMPARSGRGIVYLGEGRYWHMLCVGVRMCRKVTNLPIQVWYDSRLGPISPRDLDGIASVSFHDLAEGGWWTRQNGGWQNKTTALLRSGLSQMLFLDADAYLVGDPELIWDCAAKGGIAYWADFPGNDGTVKWDWMPGPNAVRVPPVQGGQLAIDAGVWMRELILAHWMNQHSDYYYRYQYGDQDSWRVVLAATGQRGVCLGNCEFYYPAFMTRIFHPVVVHRAAKKLYLNQHGDWNDMLPKESEAKAIHQEISIGQGTARDAFRRVHSIGVWGPSNTSGGGGDQSIAIPYLHLLRGLVADQGWSTAVDAGSGDTRITRQLPFSAIVAVDCFAPHIELAKTIPKVCQALDIDLDTERDRIPAAQVLLIKDVLHHWPNRLVIDWLVWAMANGPWEWVIATNDFHQSAPDADCALGGYRGLNPECRPLVDLSPVVVGYCGHKVTVAFRCRSRAKTLRIQVLPVPLVTTKNQRA